MHSPAAVLPNRPVVPVWAVVTAEAPKSTSSHGIVHKPATQKQWVQELLIELIIEHKMHLKRPTES